jgi:hypothetical protein
MFFSTASRLAPNLIQMNPFHAFPFYFCKAHFNIILLSDLGLPSIVFSPVLRPKPQHVFLFPHVYHMPQNFIPTDVITVRYVEKYL